MPFSAYVTSASTSQVVLVVVLETSTKVTVGVPMVVPSQAIVGVKLLAVSERFVSVKVAITTWPVLVSVTAFKVCTGVVSVRSLAGARIERRDDIVSGRVRCGAPGQAGRIGGRRRRSRKLNWRKQGGGRVSGFLVRKADWEPGRQHMVLSRMPLAGAAGVPFNTRRSSSGRISSCLASGPPDRRLARRVADFATRRPGVSKLTLQSSP